MLQPFHFMGRCAFNVSGDRKTSSVCDGHDLGAFAALCLADSKAPFLPARSYSSCAGSWTMRLKTLHLTHCCNRLWQVWCGGYRSGKSFQCSVVGSTLILVHDQDIMHKFFCDSFY